MLVQGVAAVTRVQVEVIEEVLTVVRKTDEATHPAIGSWSEEYVVEVPSEVWLAYAEAALAHAEARMALVKAAQESYAETFGEKAPADL